MAQWSIEEIEAWGRNDIAALKGMESGQPVTEAQRQPGEPPENWRDEWKEEVAAKQRAALERMKTGR